MAEWIVGSHPVYEVLKANRRKVFSLLISESAQKKERLADIVLLSSELGIQVSMVPRDKIDSIGSNNQGVAAEVSAYPYAALQDILERASSQDEAAFILILDTLQDPQNMGTLLRTAEIVGVHGIILPFRQTATITPAVVNASSGASEHLLVSQANLSQSINKLKESGIWVLGLDGSPDAREPSEIDLSGPLAIVVGSEGQGMRPLVRKSCDFLMRLPMRGQIESLNAAVAGSIALYFAWQVRGYS